MNKTNTTYPNFHHVQVMNKRGDILKVTSGIEGKYNVIVTQVNKIGFMYEVRTESKTYYNEYNAIT